MMKAFCRLGIDKSDRINNNAGKFFTRVRVSEEEAKGDRDGNVQSSQVSSA